MCSRMYRLRHSTTNICRNKLTVYTIEFLLSLRDTPFCKEKPADLPDNIDRDKAMNEGGQNRGIRKQRRQGSHDGDITDSFQAHLDHTDEYRNKNRSGHPSMRRENHGWQPINHHEHTEEFHSRIPASKSAPSRFSGMNADSNGRIVPGKGVPRRPNDQHGPISVAKAATGGKWDHQPALANVVSRQQQGLTGVSSHAEVGKGLDAFSMGDIRQAEKFIESGRMGLDEYARKIASGEIGRNAAPENTRGVGFFAEDDEAPGGSRPWFGNSIAIGTPPQFHGSLVPGSAPYRPIAVAPPHPSSAQRNISDLETGKTVPGATQGKESNASGLALLQMLIDRKAPTSTQKVAPPSEGTRQLTQHQINELIAMSKKTGQKAAPQVNSGPGRTQPVTQSGAPRRSTGSNQPAGQRTQIIPGQQSRSMQPPAAKNAPTQPVTNQTPPHVAALLEQLHRQQMAQQQSGQTAASSAQPQECQQQ